MDRIDSFANFVIARENANMEAMVDPVNETIWANQKAIAALFDVTAQSGARGTSDEKVKYFTATLSKSAIQ